MSCKFTLEDRRRLAAKAGLSEVFLYQCLIGFRDMSPKDAVKAEKATRGELSRRDLRKDWPEIWPELVKRRAVTAQRS